MVQSSQGWLLNLDLQLSQTRRSQPQVSSSQSSERSLSQTEQQHNYERYIQVILGNTYLEEENIFLLNYRFMVVRHPFERILSAYRDKLEDISRDLEARDGYYYTVYGKNIVSEFRDKTDTNLTGIIEPTWREFVTYILNTPVTKFDEHWMPIWMLCSPCIIR